MSKIKINENFFKKINTQETAYILGLLYADGWIENNHTFGIELLEHDKDILERIKSAMHSEQKLYPRIQKINNKLKYVFRVHRSCMVQDLICLGCTERKSLTLKFPNKNIVPDELMSHFIRGYFDGDGSVSEGRNVKVNFTGNTDFILNLRDYLANNSILNANKPNYGKNKDRHILCTMEWSGRGNAKKLFNYLYKDAVIYGQRKYNKFKEIICALDKKLLSETGLIAGTPEMVISSQASIEEGSSTIPEMEVESSDSKCPALNK